jgi:hypothetical protein
MAFLADEERRFLTRADGTFRVSLYKALLFLELHFPRFSVLRT